MPVAPSIASGVRIRVPIVGHKYCYDVNFDCEYKTNPLQMVTMPQCRHFPASRLRRSGGAALCILLMASWIGIAKARAQVAVTDASSTFQAMLTPNGTLMTDPFNDEAGGQTQGDFISMAAGTSGIYENGSSSPTTLTSDVPGFMIKSGQLANDSSNQYLMFRFLLQNAPTHSSDDESTLVGVGIDLNHDGRPDIVLGVNATSSQPTLFFAKAGNGANTGPSTMTLAPYRTSASTTLNTGSSTGGYQGGGHNGGGHHGGEGDGGDGDGDGDDSGGSTSKPVTFAYTAAPVSYATTPNSKVQNMNLTFAISFANLQQAIRDMGIVNGVDFSNFTLTGNSLMSFVAGSGTDDQLLDLFGTGSGFNSNGSWNSLGAMSGEFDADGNFVPTPEPSTVVQTAVLLLAGIGLLAWRRQRRRGPGDAAAGATTDLDRASVPPAA